MVIKLEKVKYGAEYLEWVIEHQLLQSAGARSSLVSTLLERKKRLAGKLHGTPIYDEDIIFLARKIIAALKMT